MALERASIEMDLVNLNKANNIPEAFHTLASHRPDDVLYSQPKLAETTDTQAPRKWIQTTYRTVQERVNAISQFLLSLGLEHEEPVAILSNTRPEWMEADMGILSAGGVVVPIYQSLIASDIAYILFDSGARIAFAENQEQVNKLLEINEKSWTMPGHADREAVTASVSIKQIIAFEQVEQNPLVEQLDSLLISFPSECPDTWRSLGLNDKATIAYTSGTLGPPKGVIQTHGNHLANVRQAVESKMLPEEPSIMLILPLAHSFAKLGGNLGFLTHTQLRFAAIVGKHGPTSVADSITRDMRECKARIFPVVPRILEKMHEGVLLRASKKTLAGLLLKACIWSAISLYKDKQRGISVPLLAQITACLTMWMRQIVRKHLFGPTHYYALCGGAKLRLSTAEFFDALGIEVVEGYGLTETCVAVTVNRPDNKKIGSVGFPLAKDNELRIDEHGEVCIRGPNVCPGYFNRPSDTKESWDESGWFHTGDLGTIDDQGFLTLHGRSKEIIITSGGKNISPHNIEEKLTGTSNCISHAAVFGEGRKHLIALISLAENLDVDPQVQEQIQNAISKVNKELAPYEAVRKFAIIPEDFTIENGLLTPTLKLKRHTIRERYSDIIENLYSER